MNTYVRPVIHPQVFLDASGGVIEYGDRWGMNGPPEDTYSVDTHPQRFLPLHTIAAALLNHVAETFDVTVVEDVNVAEDLLYEQVDVIRAVRVSPRLEGAAALTFVFTSYPAIAVHAGALSDASYPPCGCDACDESVEQSAESLESLVLAVVQGRFWERLGSGHNPWVESGVRSVDGDSWSRSQRSDFPLERLRTAQRVLAHLPDGWSAWPLKKEGCTASPHM